MWDGCRESRSYAVTALDRNTSTLRWPEAPVSGTLDQAWEAVSPDPDLESDLGYQLRELSVIRVEESEEKYIILPSEEEHLFDDEFIVAAADSIRLLDDCR